MQLPWRKKEVVKYMPIPSFGSRTELWADVEYLNKLKTMVDEKQWIVEVTGVVSAIREYADSATSTEELKGITKCLNAAKSLLVLSHYAKDKISDLENKVVEDELAVM
jgi:hypothetical protein